MTPGVSLVVVTYNPGLWWSDWLHSVNCQTVPFVKKIIIDSSSDDGCLQRSDLTGFDVVTIMSDEFDHGGTRQLALEYIGDSDIVVYLTQDAILIGEDAIKNLVRAFEDDNVAIAYGRQVPNENSTSVEAHARLFNYPQVSHVYGFDDKANVGLKVAFNSNSFSAYRVSAMRAINGFRSNVIFGEDMLVAAEALEKGHQIAYQHEACVFHSHAYSIKQEFQRYFDMGVMHDTEKWLLTDFGKPVGEGFRFIRSEFSYLLNKAPWRIPEALIRTFMKYTGYRLGLSHSRLSHSLKIMFSMNKQYWNK